ncbi:hypothetical protein [Mammaliicoccus sciuri]|uniref:hypothetical protein n=1 Tax=Mammaliicoccus sciuri TaxID=1296 RepID=UPI0021CEB786|nr:hypothetical protein [Mammaliicoccus sciuri]UXV31913.1 hypothetical protein MUA60_13370 [Mammaliicoccus sciuri]
MIENKKLSQEDLLKIVWKDLYRLLGDMNRTFNLILNLFLVLVFIELSLILLIIGIALIIL